MESEMVKSKCSPLWADVTQGRDDVAQVRDDDSDQEIDDAKHGSNISQLGGEVSTKNADDFKGWPARRSATNVREKEDDDDDADE